MPLSTCTTYFNEAAADDSATLSTPAQSRRCSSASSSLVHILKGYAFHRGRHAGSFFLKIGCAGTAAHIYLKIQNFSIIFKQSFTS